MGKKKPDISGAQARKMSPAQILRELKKGKTVSGISDYLADHYDAGMVRDVPVREIAKLQKRMGSLWDVETVKTKPGGGIVDSARELFGKGKGQPPPNGRSSWW